MIPKVFFDEAGNTGSNITNREQSSCVPTFSCGMTTFWQQTLRFCAPNYSN